MGVEIKLLGTDELNKKFAKLTIQQQKKVIESALVQSGNIIKNQGIKNYVASKKNGYNKRTDRIKKSFRTKKSKINAFEVLTGSYKHIALWLNSGTANRVTKQKAGGKGGKNRGKINARNFWQTAVNQKGKEALDNIEKAIINNMNRIFNKK